MKVVEYTCDNSDCNKKSDSIDGWIMIGSEDGSSLRIENNFNDYGFDAGRTKKITGHLPDFGKSNAYALDGDEGIWCEEDFDKIESN